MNLVDKVKNAGVVGAGGAGFPTYVKLSSTVEWYLANGAECEPLMHKDRELMTAFAADVISGLKLAAETVRAERVVIGIKRKNATAIQAIQSAIDDGKISVKEFGDFYPVGDEYELVYEITGRLIPPQGLPLDVGCVVNNVETLYNIYRASLGQPVTDTFLTVTGLVKNPLTTRVPIGMPVEEVLNLAGGVTTDSFALMESGLMMGKRIYDLRQPVSKTTGGLIVLPAEHPLIQRYDKPPKVKARIGHSACDQCSYCTELCPRYLLGYNIQPHLVMRSLGFTSLGSEIWNQHALLCSQCGLCTLYSCPESLYPREACGQGMQDMRTIGKGKWTGAKEVKVHPMRSARRTPLKQLMNRLGVAQYDAHAGYIETNARPDRVYIPLQQHIGVAASPVVRAGDVVQKGQLIGRIPDDKLGAPVHASIEGHVREVRDDRIVIERTS